MPKNHFSEVDVIRVREISNQPATVVFYITRPCHVFVAQLLPTQGILEKRPCHVFVAQLLLEAVGCFTAQAECQSRAALAGEADP